MKIVWEGLNTWYSTQQLYFVEPEPEGKFYFLEPDFSHTVDVWHTDSINSSKLSRHILFIQYNKAQKYYPEKIMAEIQFLPKMG